MDGREVWAWSHKLSAYVHLQDEARTLCDMNRGLTACGSCRSWMTKRCPNEVTPPLGGRRTGPSCSSQVCGLFDMNAASRKLEQQNTARLIAIAKLSKSQPLEGR